MTVNTLKEADTAINPGRRQAMGVLGAISALGTIGLMGYSNSSTNASGTRSGVTDLSLLEASAVPSQVLIPSETLGIFPLATILSHSSLLREAIHEDKSGIPLRVKLKLVNANDHSKPVSGYVYVWHCDSEGLYSGYDADNNPRQAGKTHCRGLQATDANGQAIFTTIYPGRQAEHVAHINLQIFLPAASGVASSSAIVQMAFPAEINAAVYQSNVYSKSQQASLQHVSEDTIVSDNSRYQVATVSGNIVEGYVAELVVGIAA